MQSAITSTGCSGSFRRTHSASAPLPPSKTYQGHTVCGTLNPNPNPNIGALPSNCRLPADMKRTLPRFATTPPVSSRAPGAPRINSSAVHDGKALRVTRPCTTTNGPGIAGVLTTRSLSPTGTVSRNRNASPSPRGT